MKFTLFLALIVGQAAAAATKTPIPITEAEQLDLPVLEVDVSEAEAGAFINADLTAIGFPVEKPEEAYLPFAQVGWIGVVTPDGPEVEYWGDSLDAIEATIKKDHPDFSIHEDIDLESPANVTRRSLERRDWGERNCRTFGYATLTTTWEGIHALRRMKGSCVTPPRRCTRMFMKPRTGASHGTAIVACNDTRNTLKIPCKWIGDGAWELKEHCYMFDGVFCSLANPSQKCWRINERVHGQIFADHRKWNVLVGSPERLGGSFGV